MKSQLLRNLVFDSLIKARETNEDKKLIFQKIRSSASDKTTYKKQAFVEKTT